jgi:electron transport complex protein RnfD
VTDSRLLITASPHLSAKDTTPKIMWSVVATLVPIIGAAAYIFGPSAFLVVSAATVGTLVTEWVFGSAGTLRDGSAVITGLLLGLTLPAGLPLWMAFVGGAFGIGFGKLIFGGLGQNIFNPALLGRAFLQAAFPVAMTTWPIIDGRWWSLRGDNLALPLMSASTPDALTGATPLGLMKFEQTGYLAVRNYLNWRIPASILLTVAMFAGVLHLVDPVRFAGPLFMVFSGGLMLGAMYMATDMVTSPVTNIGAWIFGIGIGILVVVIRVWGGLAEGVMYAILLMNALVPFINRATRPRAETNPPAGDGAPSATSLEPRHGAPSWRLVSTLAMAGVIAGLLIVFVYRTTLPAIEAHKARSPSRTCSRHRNDSTLSTCTTERSPCGCRRVPTRDASTRCTSGSMSPGDRWGTRSRRVSRDSRMSYG